MRVKYLNQVVQEYLEQHGTDTQRNHAEIEKDLLHLAMYRPLTRVAGFERIATWDLTHFKEDMREVLKVHVLEPVEQRALVEGNSDRPGVTVLSPISNQNAQVGQFYTSRIYSTWFHFTVTILT